MKYLMTFVAVSLCSWDAVAIVLGGYWDRRVEPAHISTHRSSLLDRRPILCYKGCIIYIQLHIHSPNSRTTCHERGLAELRQISGLVDGL